MITSFEFSAYCEVSNHFVDKKLESKHMGLKMLKETSFVFDRKHISRRARSIKSLYLWRLVNLLIETNIEVIKRNVIQMVIKIR